MAKQDVNIGVEGNDGTGDSIRESFRKVNENFNELYAVFGQGGQIRFTLLSDTPDTLVPNTVAFVDDAASEIQLREFASNSAVTPSATDTITFSYDIPGKIVISSAFTSLSEDQFPTLGQPLNANGNAIANVAISDAAASDYRSIHGQATGVTIDDLVINKRYADQRYLSNAVPLRLDDEPADGSEYILEVSRYINGYVEVLNHGFDSTINGTPFVFDAEDTDPTNLASGVTYYIRFVDSDRLAIYDTAEKAREADPTVADTTKISVSGNIASNDTHTFTDAAYDTDLTGFFLSNEPMPRKSVVRKQGDTMDGDLILNDHPGELAGLSNVREDLQAATKFYVDNTSYSSPENLFVSTTGDDTMDGVPAGKEGTSLSYAYASINAAAKRAEELINTAPTEPGPYMQTITKENNGSEATVTVAEIDSPAFTQEFNLIQSNKRFLIKEIIAFVNRTYPDFTYDEDTCARDLGLILDAISYDVKRGSNANYLTRLAAERYYSSVSGRIAVTRQLTVTYHALQEAEAILDTMLVNEFYRKRDITNISSANPGVVTTDTNHQLKSGDRVIIDDVSGLQVGGNSVVNETIFFVKPLTTNTFELFTDQALTQPFDTTYDPFDASTPTQYTLGGKIGLRYQDDEEQFIDTVGGDASAAGISQIGNKWDLIEDILTANVSDTYTSGGQTDFTITSNPNNISELIVTQQGSPQRPNIDYTLNGQVVSFTNTVPSGEQVIVTHVIKSTDPTAQGVNVIYGSTYKLVIDNGGLSAVDQSSDTLPGKVMVGKISGAAGIIVEVTANDGSESNNDTYQLHMIRAKDFIVGEAIEYGNFVKRKQVTIFVESGQYEEDYPIRVARNVSIKGDEFRRVIVRPKDRISQSPYANTYFYRDKEFDGLTLATEGTPFFNQVGVEQGFFGRHYLERPDRDINVGATVTNVGNYPIAVNILKENKLFIIQEFEGYINDQYPALVYTSSTFQRIAEKIVDALAVDLTKGGQEESLEVQGDLHSGYEDVQDSTQENAIEDGITYIGTLAASLFSGSAPATTYGLNYEEDLQYGSAESGVTSVASNLLGVINFAFDVNYNPPLRNDEMDVFMMSDATILRNLTVQGHGGFMSVLDPEGSILTKSPYIQTGSSFSKSINEKTFAGGMYVDAFVGNIPCSITGQSSTGNPDVDLYKLFVESAPGQGFRLREPLLPAPFYIDGRRYQVNAISDYNQALGTATIYLDKSSNGGDGYVASQFETDPGVVARDIFLQTAGNRSMLGNDFTQINDLGYGLVTNNGAFSEMVSMFTYYCQAAYYANNGSEIRSLNGSNGYGFFGLVAEGADPNEVPDQVTLKYNMVQPLEVLTQGSFANAAGDTSIIVFNAKRPPTAQSIIQVEHTTAGRLSYLISGVEDLTTNTGSEQVFISGIQATASLAGTVDATGVYNVNASGGSGSGAQIQVTVTAGGVIGSGGSATIAVADIGSGYQSGDTLTIAAADIGGGSATNLTFDVTIFGDTLIDPNDADRRRVYKLDIVADEAVADDFFGDLEETVPTGTIIEYRDLQNLIFEGINNRDSITTRPSTAINFDESDDTTYRSIAFSTEDSVANDLGNKEVMALVDNNFDFIELQVDGNNIGGGQGSAQGDTQIALTIDTGDNSYDAAKLQRLLRDIHGNQPGATGGDSTTTYQGGMVFSWAGKTHRIVDAQEIGVAPASYLLIDIEDVPGTNISAYGGTGLAAGLTDAYKLIAGLAEDSTAEITIAISLLRATGHDFTQIGTGGFNASNYPNVVLGPPDDTTDTPEYIDSATGTKAQVWERRKGRVFFVSTDQNGFFRVGKFFSVDQGTGDIEFSGSIGLTNANSLGFKKGVTINEFSADDSFADESGKAVPTEAAVASYLSRRLGYSSAGAQIRAPSVGNRLGPGFLALNGDTEMEGSISMGSFNITNLAVDTSDGTCATNKNYVDAKANEINKLEQLRNFEDNQPTVPNAGEMLISTGKKKIVVENISGGSFTIGYQIESGVKTGLIVDVQTVAANAFIGTGSRNIITYTPTNGEFQTADAISERVYSGSPGALTGVTADMIGDPSQFPEPPVDEYTHATVQNDPSFGNTGTSDRSDIVVTVTRNAADTTVNLQYETDSLINADVNSDARIAQSKLHMNRAEILGSSTGMYGEASESGTQLAGQSNRGLAAFNSDSFAEDVQLTLTDTETLTAGDVLYQGANRGIVTASTSASNTVVVRTSTGFDVSGVDIEKATHSVSAPNIGEEPAAASLSNTITKVERTGFVSLMDDSVDIQKIQEIGGATDYVGGTVIGRASDETGRPQQVNFDTVIKQGLGLEDEDFSLSELTTAVERIATLNYPANVNDVSTLTLSGDTGTGTVQGQVYAGNKIALKGTSGTFTNGLVVRIGGVTLTSSDGGYSSVTATFSTPTNRFGKALVQVDDGLYATTAISETGTKDSLVRRWSSANYTGAGTNVPQDGAIQAEAFILGGSAENQILSESGGVLSFNTPQDVGGQILQASGSNNTGQNGVTVRMKGALDVGEVAGTSGAYVEGDLQTASGLENEGFVAADWMYTSFIEAQNEAGAANSTGIGLGDQAGLTNSAANTIVMLAGGSEQIVVDNNGITFNDAFTQTDATDATNTTSGSMQTAGGMGIGKKLYVGGDFDVNSNFNVAAATGNTDIDGTLVVEGQTTINDSLLINAANEVFRIRNGSDTVNRFIVDTDNGNTTINGTLTVNGNTTIGNATSDNLTINARLASNLDADADNTYNIGSSGRRFNTMYAYVFNGTATIAQYADLAENYLGDNRYDPGTVLVFGGQNEVTVTDKKSDHRVAGVVSTNPAHLMNGDLFGEFVNAVALQGRVPCKVIGKVQKGDLLVTSSMHGYAMVDNDAGPGRILGKAMENKDDTGKGIIEIAVGRA